MPISELVSHGFVPLLLGTLTLSLFMGVLFYLMQWMSRMLEPYADSQERMAHFTHQQGAVAQNEEEGARVAAIAVAVHQYRNRNGL